MALRYAAASLALAVALAGCGASSPKPNPKPGPTPQAAPLVACPRAVRNAVAEAAHSSSSSWHVTDATLHDTTCVLVSGTVADSTRVRVTIDTLPSPFKRFSDAEEETWQNTAGWANFPARKPRPRDGVGNGAYWIPADRRLEAADDKTHVSVVVLASRTPEKTALRVGRAALEPPSFTVPKEREGG